MKVKDKRELRCFVLQKVAEMNADYHRAEAQISNPDLLKLVKKAHKATVCMAELCLEYEIPEQAEPPMFPCAEMPEEFWTNWGAAR